MPSFDPTYIAIVIVGLLACVLGLCAFYTLTERKLSAWMQDRLGPNRVGPGGLLQPIVDGGKFFLKEEVIPSHVDKIFYILAPAVALGTALMVLAVVPFGSTTPPPDPVSTAMVVDGVRVPDPAAVNKFEQAQATHQQSFNFVLNPGLDVGVLYIFALGSLAVYGVILAGWSANSKYSLLGSLRASAQIISYEIPLGMAVLGVFLIVGSLNPEKIIDWQTRDWPRWLILFQPLALMLFMVSLYAEDNRLPFDLPEAEQGLVGGYHTEYSALKLGLMLLSEYVHLVVGSFHGRGAFSRRLRLFGLESVSLESDRGGDPEALHPVRENVRAVFVRAAHPLDDPAIPLRPTHEHRVEGDDPAVDPERAVRDVRETTRPDSRPWLFILTFTSLRCSSRGRWCPCGYAAR